MLKNPINLLLILALLSGCSIFKKAPQQDYSQFVFENTGDPVAVINDSTKTPDSLVIQEKSNAPDKVIASKEEVRLKNKYAAYLSVPPDKITDLKLYEFIDDWLNTPYLWAGTTKSGIDCSAFIQRLFSSVYRIRIPRTSVQQFFTQNVERFTVKRELAKGDLVFFRTIPGTYVSHVGMYLDNNRFVNSSSSKGVSIASLSDPYWAGKYVGAGRLIVNKSVRVD
ncbi:MAG: C40 family peptidase [Niabella sp.]